jgi:hypothetical protein
MNLLLDYQQIIIKSTYERNNVAFAPAADCATSLRALMRMLRRDMESFVAAGESTDFYLLCISILSSIFSRCFLGFVMASSNLFKKFPTFFFFFFFFFFFSPLLTPLLITIPSQTNNCSNLFSICLKKMLAMKNLLLKPMVIYPTIRDHTNSAFSSTIFFFFFFFFFSFFSVFSQKTPRNVLLPFALTRFKNANLVIPTIVSCARKSCPALAVFTAPAATSPCTPPASAGASQPCISMTSIRSTRSSATPADAGAAAATTTAAAAPAAAPAAAEEKAATEELYEQGSVWDKYTRKGVLGKGGCGVVYKVVNKVTKEAFALKQMKKDSYLLDILEREIMIMKKFDHPHLTKLREAYLDDKFICLVMDYVAGGELFDKIAELEFFSEKDAADITKQLLSALSYLHERGCAHRDIKAENILLVDKEGTQVKIADFGLANTLGNRNKFMSFVGTTPYMAPEVLSGACFPESDHQLLTNRGFMSLADVEAHIVVDAALARRRRLARPRVRQL